MSFSTITAVLCSLFEWKKGGVKRASVFLALFFLSGSLSSAQTLVWSEEFNYTSAPDSDVWSYDLGSWGWGNAELQDYTSSTNNVWVDGSNLVITAERAGNYFSSGRIKTQDKLTFKYGTIEARIQAPDLADGLWPAFWTLGNNFPIVGWPDCGEIDVMEMGSGGSIAAGLINRRVGSHAHWDNNGAYNNQGLSYDMPTPINDTFVIYRLEWTPNDIKTYINGNLIWSFSINPAIYPSRSEFHNPHFLLLNMAVGGTYTGRLNANDITASFPAEYKIDYIRLYDVGDTVLGGSSQVQPPVPGTNLFVNSGFESGTTGWTSSLSGGSASASSAYAHGGANALKIDSTGAGGWASPNLSQTFTASPGDVFTLQGYMLNPAGSPIAGGSFGLFKIEFLDSGGNPLDPATITVGSAAGSPYFGAESTPLLNAGSATDTWIFSESQAEAPANTVNVRFVVLNVNDPGNPGAMYYDDIEAALLGGTNNPPVFAADPVLKTNATEDMAYTGQTLAGTATDPNSDPLSYSLLSGGPAWLNVATNGTLSGTPGNADVGLNSWTIWVSDGISSPVSATLEITVDNVNDAPVFTVDPIVMPNAIENRAYSSSIAGSATDVDVGAVLSYSLVPGGPAWLNVATNGILSGTPGHADVGTNNWTVQVSDGLASNTASLTIIVDARIPGVRLLENPGFESSTTGWVPSLSGGTATTSMTYAHGGADSLVIDSTGAGDWASPNLSQSFSASSGDVFNLQGYMLNPASHPITGASFGLFKIEFRDSGGAVLAPASVDIGTAAASPFYGAESVPHLNVGSAADTWVYSEVQAVAPAGTATVGFYILNVNQPGNPGPMYFDDIQAIWINAPILAYSANFSISGGNVHMSFPTQNGIGYSVSYKSNLTHSTWIPLETIIGDGNTNSVYYPMTDAIRFYHIETP